MKKDICVDRIKDEVKELLEKTKSSLRKMGRETAVFAKRGEKELSRIAGLGREEVGVLGLNIRKNRLFYELGKKVHQLNTQGRLTTRSLKSLCDKIMLIDKDLGARKRSIARYLRKKVVILAALSLFCINLVGCGETVGGVGKDVKRIGKGVKTIFVRDANE